MKAAKCFHYIFLINYMHPRNKHQGRYDFKQLIATLPELEAFVHANEHGSETINFFEPDAVKMLNKALLQHHYDIQNWDIPEAYLCPPIPGRVDYMHHIADLLAETNKGKIPHGQHIRCLDIGTGASCIYPLLGHQEYSWSFIATDIHKAAIKSSQQILEANPTIATAVDLRLQERPKAIFKGVLKMTEKIDVVVCNPPFHRSLEEAQKAAARKLRNLKADKKQLNFGGQAHELWSEGGEVQFVQRMIRESHAYAASCLWFTTLVSKEDNLKRLIRRLKTQRIDSFKVIPMGQGNKQSRILAWTFLKESERKEWARVRFALSV